MKMQRPMTQSDLFDSQRPSKRTRFWLGFGAGAITCALLIVANLVVASSEPHSGFDLFGGLFEVCFLVTWLIATMLPLCVAPIAALMTRQYVPQEVYKLACRTG